jgi:hypothetical protein
MHHHLTTPRAGNGHSLPSVTNASVSCGNQFVVQLKPSPIAAMFEPFLASSLVDQNPSHRLSRCSKEMPASLPLFGILGSHQLHVNFVYQRRCLQRLPWPLLSHTRRGKFSQLVIDQRQQIGRSLTIAVSSSGEKLRNVLRHSENELLSEQP